MTTLPSNLEKSIYKKKDIYKEEESLEHKFSQLSDSFGCLFVSYTQHLMSSVGYTITKKQAKNLIINLVNNYWSKNENKTIKNKSKKKR